MIKRLFPVLLFTALLAPLCAGAWNNHGHGTIAYIAEQNLTPVTREKCHEHLNHTLHYYASWLDHWRFTEPYKHTTRWHAVIYNEDNERERCSTLAVVMTDKIWNTMRDGGYKKLSDSIVTDNIKYLIHLVGDLHSPVHIFFARKDGSKEHKHNQGFSVYWGKKRKKMGFHTFWDRGSQYLHPSWSYADYHKNIDNYSPKRRAAVVEGTPYTWGLEGAVSLREIYDLMPPESVFEQLPEASVERMRQINDRQLVVGGYRLAHILNTIFDEEYCNNLKK